MSKTIEEKAAEFAGKYKENFISNTLQADNNAYVAGIEVGFIWGQREYEEKLRWIPVEEKLPEKIQTEPSVSKVVQVKSKNFSEPFCAFYNHLYGIWLPYPFGSNSQIVGITEWRSFL